jgi:GNAT superfamily N-acetyltransferase
MLAGMDFVLYDEPDAFWSTVAPVFEADPIRHTIALTVLSGLRVAGTDGFDAPLLVSITDGESVVGAAFCTPPWPLGVSGVPVDVVPQLVEFLREREYTPSGVTGPRPPADAFAAAWGGQSRVLMNMRCYRLGQLEPPEVLGELRLAEASDVQMLAGFEQEFMREAAHDPGGNYGQRVRQSLVLGNAHGIWSDGGGVRAMARASVPQRGMSRVGLVYTPPEHRRRGYGAAVTAAVSGWALANGADDVVLFTDLANPTSNSIYQRIGYTPVYDAVEYRFGSTTVG